MAAKAINQNDINDIVKFYSDTMKTVDKQNIDVKQTKKSLHTFSTVSSQIIEFYDISNSITQSIIESGVRFEKNTFEAQKSMIESINTIITAVNSFNSMKLPNMVQARIRIWRLGKEVGWITRMFLGPGGIAGSLNAFDNLKEGREHITYDSKGNVISKYTVQGLKPTDVVKGFSDIVNSVTDIVKKSDELSKNIIKTYVELNLAWPRLIGGKKHPGIIDRYVNLIKSDEFKTLQDKAVKTQISNVVSSVKSLTDIVENISESFSLSDIIKLHIYEKFIVLKVHDILEQLVGLTRDQLGKPYKFTVATIKTAGEAVKETNTIIVAIGSIGVGDLIKVSIAAVLIDKVLGKVKIVIRKISEFSKEVSETAINGDTEKQIQNIKSIIDSMLGWVGQIGLLALAFPVVLLSYLPALGTLHLIKNIVYLSIHILNVIGKITDGKEYKNTVIAVSNITKVLGLILLMVAEVLGTLVLISLTLPLLTKSFWTTVGVFTIISGLVLLIAGLAWLINRMFRGGVGKTISEGLLLMISLIGVMLLVGGQLLLFAYAGVLFFGEDWNGGLWSHALAMFGVVAGATLAIGGLGYLLTLMLPGIAAFAISSIALLISIGALLLTANTLIELAEVKFEEDTQKKVQEKTKLIIDTAHDIMNAMFRGWTKDESGELTSNESEDSEFKRFFKGLFQGGAMVVETLASSLVLVMTFVSVTMLLTTAAMLEVIGKIDLTSSAITSNVGMVIGVAHGVIDAVLNKETPVTKGTPEDKKGPIRSLLSGVGDVFKGIKNIIDGVLSFGFIAFTMVSIGMITLIAKNLKYLEGIELNQKTIEAKVQAVIGTANSLIDHINSSNINKDNIKKVELTKKFMEQIEKTVSYMSKIGEMNNLGQFDKAVDSYVRFVDKINTVKLENLQTATNMFEKMAEFSKSISGNFEGLADAINDKIMPLLEELNNSLDKTNKSIDGGVFNQPVVSYSNPVITPAHTSTSAPAPTQTVPPPKDYSRILNEIKQEITKVQKTLTDGSQRTTVDSR